MDAAKQQDASSELFVALTVKQVLTTAILRYTHRRAKERGCRCHLPIWVWSAEGNAIRLAMDHVVTPRPMSHDLIRKLADHLGVQLNGS